jgi:AcrR family transcriptional regulator
MISVMTSQRLVDGSAPLRADARRNVAAILDAATTCLALDPEASMAAIAAAAGVGRVTLYGHFENRATLVAQVVERAMEQSDAELAAVDLSGDPTEALGRLLDTTWRVTHQYGGLVLAAERALPDADLQAAHRDPRKRVLRVLRRGRREGAFRTDVPLGWQVTTIQGLVHAASAAVHRGELTARRAPELVRTTVLATLVPPPAS